MLIIRVGIKETKSQQQGPITLENITRNSYRIYNHPCPWAPILELGGCIVLQIMEGE